MLKPNNCADVQARDGYIEDIVNDARGALNLVAKLNSHKNIADANDRLDNILSHYNGIIGINHKQVKRLQEEVKLLKQQLAAAKPPLDVINGIRSLLGMNAEDRALRADSRRKARPIVKQWLNFIKGNNV